MGALLTGVLGTGDFRREKVRKGEPRKDPGTGMIQAQRPSGRRGAEKRLWAQAEAGVCARAFLGVPVESGWWCALLLLKASLRHLCGH